MQEKTSFRAKPTESGLLSPPGGGRFEAVIFDMGSTLLEFENVPWPVLYHFSFGAAYNCLKRLGYDPPPLDVLWERFNRLFDARRERLRTDLREYQIGPLLRATVQTNGVRLRPGDLSRLCDAYYAAIRRQVTAYPDAKNTLAMLRAAGYRLGLLSNTPFRVIDHREELEHFGLWTHLDAALFTSTIRHRKPHPEPFREIARRLGVPLSRCLYIGDRQKEDVIGPQGVGMTAVLVRRRLRRYEPGLTMSAEIDELSELPDLLGNSTE